MKFVRIKFNSIFTRYLRNFSFFVLIPFVIICAIIFMYNVKNIEYQINHYSSNSYQQVSNVINVLSDTCDKYTYSLLINKYVNLFITRSFGEISNKANFDNVNSLQNTLNTLIFQSEYIDSIFIFSDKNRYIVSSRNAGRFTLTDNSHWYDTYNEMPENSPFWYDVHTLSTINTLSFYRIVDNNESKGLIGINIDLSKLQNVLSNASSLSSSDSLFIIDNDGRIVFSENSDLLNKKFYDIYNVTANDKSSIIYVSNVKYKCSIEPLNTRGLNCALLIDLTQYGQQYKTVFSILLIVFLISLIATLFLSYYMAKIALKPITEIISIIDNPEIWYDFDKQNDKNYFDEIKYIITNIVKSFKTVRDLEEELTDKFFLLKKTQEVALQAQIQPHFLYNTLETINMAALDLTGGENEVSTLICSLSDLLRISFKTKNNIISIRDELKHAKKYIDIQKTRYEDKFTVEWNVEPEIHSYKTVKLILQPVIENAIYHGIKPLEKNGIIKISGYIKNNSSIVFEISDNGKGIDPQKIEALQKQLSNQDTHFKSDEIGLSNVNQRIKLIFGQQYGCSISSDSAGTAVTITIPKMKHIPN